MWSEFVKWSTHARKKLKGGKGKQQQQAHQHDVIMKLCGGSSDTTLSPFVFLPGVSRQAQRHIDCILCCFSCRTASILSDAAAAATALAVKHLPVDAWLGAGWHACRQLLWHDQCDL